MKQKITLPLILLFVIVFTSSSHAQTTETFKPRWVSDQGYWMIESNIHTPLEHIIRFYTNDGILVYKETLTGKKLNPNRRKVKMKMKQVLESSVASWQKKKESSAELALVKNRL